MGWARAVGYFFPGHLLQLITGLSLTCLHEAPQAPLQAQDTFPGSPGPLAWQPITHVTHVPRPREGEGCHPPFGEDSDSFIHSFGKRLLVTCCFLLCTGLRAGAGHRGVTQPSLVPVLGILSHVTFSIPLLPLIG